MKRNRNEGFRATVIGRTSEVPAPTHILAIESNIPIPPKTRGRKARWPFSDMKIGESVEVLEIEADRARTAVWNTKRNYGYEFTTRKTELGIRIWRIG